MSQASVWLIANEFLQVILVYDCIFQTGIVNKEGPGILVEVIGIDKIRQTGMSKNIAALLIVGKDCWVSKNRES